MDHPAFNLSPNNSVASVPPRTIGAVVVTHNSAGTIDACLDSAVAQCDAVVVVDTDSSDGTADLVQNRGITCVRVANRGFGAACNRGVDALDTELVLFLN